MIAFAVHHKADRSEIETSCRRLFALSVFGVSGGVFGSEETCDASLSVLAVLSGLVELPLSEEGALFHERRTFQRERRVTPVSIKTCRIVVSIAVSETPGEKFPKRRSDCTRRRASPVIRRFAKRSGSRITPRVFMVWPKSKILRFSRLSTRTFPGCRSLCNSLEWTTEQKMKFPKRRMRLSLRAHSAASCGSVFEGSEGFSMWYRRRSPSGGASARISWRYRGPN